MGGAINSGDTAWLLVCCSLVLLMTPALALFYGGMVRRKNLLSTLTLSYIFMALAGVQWVLFGYSLAFGPDIGGLIGGLNFLGFNGVGALPNPDYAKTIPHGLFAAFQMMFAVITPALITGAFVERVRFKSFLLFSLIWMTLVYDPLAHWVWGKGGWLGAMGVLDFAGGTVVHIAAGFSALAFALVIGPRKGFGKIPLEPHNIAYTVLGAGLLWVGWFGFNAGSALEADGSAGLAMINTFVATAAGALTWMVAERAAGHKGSALGFCSGVIAGLVAVTPAAGNSGPFGAILLGIIASLVCYVFVAKVKAKFGYDDSLDAFGIHGVGGIVGAIGTAVVYQPFLGGPGDGSTALGAQLGVQVFSVLVTIAWAGLGTLIAGFLVKLTIGLRVDEESEVNGLDISEHGERAYN